MRLHWTVPRLRSSKPCGAPHSVTGTASFDMRFPGLWFQAESGLHYHWYRQYDPTIGYGLQAVKRTIYLLKK
jgi:uncharacterized protein RhaS with RHS repeats